jgi:AcrR family transcriptional regulator
VTAERLTRKERQAQTRSRLLESATRVFAAKGLERASVEDVVATAGYTKGAFYANFDSKQELFLAMLEERFGRRLAEVERVWSDGDSPPEQARHSAADFARAIRADPEAPRLFLEFSAYALRDEAFRDELLARFATLRERLEAIYSRRVEQYGIELDIPMDRIVRMVIAICDGWELWQLLEPDAVDEQMLEEIMEAFTIGLGVMSGGLKTPERNS